MTALIPPTRLAGRVLIVGASDASGSAGIQAALKAIGALGAFAAAAVTSIADEEGRTVHALPPEAIAAQMRTMLADIGADALYIGRLGDGAMVDAIADVLEGEARGIPAILDSADSATMLLRLARLAIVETDLADLDARRRMAADLATAGRAALVTSAAHGDVLAEGPTVSVFPAARRGTTRPVRGVRATLAAAIAAGIAQGLPLAAAVRRGRDYVEDAILTAPDFGRGPSPLNHVHTVRPPSTAGFDT